MHCSGFGKQVSGWQVSNLAEKCVPMNGSWGRMALKKRMQKCRKTAGKNDVMRPDESEVLVAVP